MATLQADLAAALDRAAFAASFGLTLDDWQTRMLRSDARRQLLNCHRQSGKSTSAALLALHTAVYRPGSLVLLVSPSLRQSSELYRKVSDFLHSMDPAPELVEDNKLSSVFANGSRVLSLPGSEETIRGYSSVDLIVEDEASRVDDGLYMAVRPMLAVSAGRLVLMATPWGKRGHFYEAWKMADLWETYRVPAEQCPRIAPEFLAEERRSMGALVYASEYGCEFTDNELTAFSTTHIEAAIDADVAALSVSTRFWEA